MRRGKGEGGRETGDERRKKGRRKYGDDTGV